MEVEPRAEGVDDRSLLSRFLAGDEAAFESLVRRHEDRIFALALRITGDRQDALEATQETFVSLFRRAASFKGEAEVGTWLYRIGINAARDVLRRRRRAPLADEPPEEAVEDLRPRARVEETTIRRLEIARALERIPPDYREAVVMHDLGGIPYEEIAGLTGVALGTVKSRISRGRRLLAELLEHHSPQGASKEAT